MADLSSGDWLSRAAKALRLKAISAACQPCNTLFLKEIMRCMHEVQRRAALAADLEKPNKIITLHMLHAALCSVAAGNRR